MWVRAEVTVTYPSGESADIRNDVLYQVIQSIQVQCPILGQLFTHNNTRGTILGNIIQYVCNGYNDVPRVPNIAPGETETRVLYIRIPFSNEYLRKPHEISPWAGFLEGGTVEIKTSPVDILSDAGFTDAEVDEINFRMWLDLIPSPEAVLHTPCHWREHTTPGGSTRHIITDMGSPDGLQGIDQSKGVGIAALYGLAQLTPLGFGGATAISSYLAFDLPFRDQDRVDVPEALFAQLALMMGNNRRWVSTVSDPMDAGGFPNLQEASVTSDPLFAAFGMVLPLISVGRDQETSKLQTVAGAKTINVQYTGATPSGSSRWLGQYYPQWDEQFAMSLAARIAPQSAGQLVAKTLNKQAGGIPSVGKLAYVRLKVK
jgi:hypothetical protein